MINFKTDQENFWAGKFGDDYIKRNMSSEMISSNINFFSKALSSAQRIESCIEFGSNIGLNLLAIKNLFPKINLHAVEINKNACDKLSTIIPKKNIINKSLLDFSSKKKFDLCIVKGVLIHINPKELQKVYEILYASSLKYILIAEYYNPSPIEINYRGHSEKLFKRDFAGEFLKKFSNCHLIDYGFSYHLDNKFPQDDINWFLIGKL